MIILTTDVFCDICPNWEEQLGITGVNARPKTARVEAKKLGWVRRFDPFTHKMIDVCPACVDEKDSK